MLFQQLEIYHFKTAIFLLKNLLKDDEVSARRYLQSEQVLGPDVNCVL